MAMGSLRNCSIFSIAVRQTLYGVEIEA